MNTKRFFAVAGLVIIALLYIVTLILAFSGSPRTQDALMASLFCTIVIPVFIYAWELVWKLLSKK